MADYRDLLRRAVDALPENNGVARRQVYDKARVALRKQLNAIDPPLAGREKTYHRLQLEECIREVEQEATERMLSGLSHLEEEAFGTKMHAPDAPGGENRRETPAAAYRPVSEARPAPTEAPARPSSSPAAPTPPDTSRREPQPVPVARAETPSGRGEPDAPRPNPVTPSASKPAEADRSSSRPDPVAPKTGGMPATPDRVMPRPQPVVHRIPTRQPTPLELAVASVESAAHGEAVRQEPKFAPPVETPAPARSEAKAAPHKDFLSHEVAPARGKAKQTPSERAVADARSASVAPSVKPADNSRIQGEEAARKNPIFARFSAKVAGFASGAEAAKPVKPTEAAKSAVPAVAAPAMSAEREVELDADMGKRVEDADPQVVIDHAIAMLDREAKGGAGLDKPVLETADPDTADIDFARAEAEDEGGGSPALTIFLVVVLLLLAGAGGAGYWAWREGYLDLSSLFGNVEATVPTTTVSDATPPAVDTQPAIRSVTGDTEIASAADTVEPSRPGNTVATPDIVETPATGLEQANAATPEAASNASALVAPDAAAPTQLTMDAETAPDAVAAASAAGTVAEPAAGDDKSEQRLPIAAGAPTDAEGGTEIASASPDVVAAGSQSLLLEASDQSNAGAVPFSGTVEWTRGVDELGQSTLNATANIPARNMSLTLLIRKNSDPTLPASHLLEIDFNVSDSFIGGGIARIAGILMKNEELVQGVPLVGASARIVGNSFLFALSADDQDIAANSSLLTSRKWMDLAIIYSTGKQALLTLEKDDVATKLFDEIVASWNAAPAPAVNPG